MTSHPQMSLDMKYAVILKSDEDFRKSNGKIPPKKVSLRG